MKTLYIDESIRERYILVGHLVAANSVGRVRKAVRSHVLAGQRSIHFVKESDSRRKYLLAQFERLDCTALVVAVSGSDPKVARQIALQEILWRTHEYDVQQIVIELDVSSEAFDRATLLAHNRSVDVPLQIDFEFLTRNSEPLLWVADAVAWAVGRQGFWVKRAASMVTRTINISL